MILTNGVYKMSKWNFIYSKDYWETMAEKDPYNSICYKFTKSDFENNKDSIIFLIPTFNKDTDLLDLGCGLGRIAKWVAPHIEMYYGIDFSSGMIKQAIEYNKKVKNVCFLVNDGKTIPFEDKKFDFVISELVFIHLDKEAQISYINEARRVLREDGTFLCQLPKISHYKNGFEVDEIDKIFSGFEFKDIGKKEHVFIIKARKLGGK